MQRERLLLPIFPVVLSIPPIDSPLQWSNMLPSLPLLCLTLFCLPTLIWAQADPNPNPQNYDYIYQPYIKSVQFHPTDSKTDYPIVELGSGTKLMLSFDDMEAYTKDYSYKIIHCNANWEPSEQLSLFDYIDGYQENRFYNAQTSIGSRVSYIHYDITLPNQDIRWTLSGNYILKVYRDTDEDDMILLRRFMVVDTKMKVVPMLRRSAAPPYGTTHQELFFTVEHVGINIGNPDEQVTPVVLQNGRWERVIRPERPSAIQQEAIRYELQGTVLFPGLKEFRPVDLRTFRFRTNQIERIEEYTDGHDIWLFEDRSRRHTPHVFTHDLNGKFFIASHDVRDEHLQGEYADVHFSLKALTPYQKPVYVLGAFNDYLPMPAYKMTYSKECLCYQLTTALKNGFYDYTYGLAENAQAIPDYLAVEGSSFETENDYLFLVYYREYGGLYDQLVAVQKMNTRPR